MDGVGGQFLCTPITIRLKKLGNVTYILFREKIMGNYLKIYALFLLFKCKYKVCNLQQKFSLRFEPLKTLATPQVWGCRLAALASRGNLLESQTLRLHPRSTASVSVFYDSQVIPLYIEV